MYVVVTSDGIVHETDDPEKFVALLDEYGPEVVSSDEPPERLRETNAAMLRQYAKPNPRPNVGSIYPA